MGIKGEWKFVQPQIGGVNAYQYNGKELNDDFGLNWNDYGARWYDASIARWNAVDPLAEFFAYGSSYEYVGNNPIAFTDPTGMSRVPASKEDPPKNRGNMEGQFSFGQTLNITNHNESYYWHEGSSSTKSGWYDIDKYQKNVAKAGLAVETNKYYNSNSSLAGLPSLSSPKSKDSKTSNILEYTSNRKPLFLFTLNFDMSLPENLYLLRGPALIAAGLNIIPTRTKLTTTAIVGTSLSSMIMRRVFSYKMPTSFAKLFPHRILGMPLGGTRILGGVLGRAVPILGWGLLAYDAGSFAYGLYKYQQSEKNEKNNE